MTAIPKHTPGPWTAIGQKVTANVYGVTTVIASTHFRDAKAGTQIGTGRAEQNARLIAAAPDLLAALEGIMVEVAGCQRDAKYEAARAAIAKVTD